MKLQLLMQNIIFSSKKIIYANETLWGSDKNAAPLLFRHVVDYCFIRFPN